MVQRARTKGGGELDGEQDEGESGDGEEEGGGHGVGDGHGDGRSGYARGGESEHGEVNGQRDGGRGGHGGLIARAGGREREEGCLFHAKCRRPDACSACPNMLAPASHSATSHSEQPTRPSINSLTGGALGVR